MTIRRSILLLTTTLALALASRASAEPDLPGQVDFGTFSPAGGGEFVEVNLSSATLSLAAKLVPKNETEMAKLLSGLQRIRVNVVGLTDENRDQIQMQMAKVRSTLTTQGWERIVTAQNKAEDVGIFLKPAGADAIAGLAVVVMDGNKEAVFVNIVGNIKMDQISAVGERLNIDPLKKLGRATQKESSKQ